MFSPPNSKHIFQNDTPPELPTNGVDNREEIVNILLSAETKSSSADHLAPLPQIVKKEDSNEGVVNLLLDANIKSSPADRLALLHKIVKKEDKEDSDEKIVKKLLDLPITQDPSPIGLLLEKFSITNRKPLLGYELLKTKKYKKEVFGLLKCAIRNENSNEKIVQMLLGHALPLHNSDIPLLLSYAVKNKNGNVDIVKMLLDHAPPKKESLYKLIHDAIVYPPRGNENIVRLLLKKLEKNADITQEQICELLLEAIIEKRPDIVDLLLNLYNPVLMPEASISYKLVLFAIQNNNEYIFNRLVKYIHAPLTPPCSDGIATLLSSAVSGNNENIFNTVFQVYITSEFKLDTPHRGYSIIKSAVGKKNINILEKVLPYMPCLSENDSKDILEHAVRHGTEEIMNRLLNHKPPLLTLTWEHSQIILAAVMQRKQNIAKILSDHIPTPSRRENESIILDKDFLNRNDRLLEMVECLLTVTDKKWRYGTLRGAISYGLPPSPITLCESYMFYSRLPHHPPTNLPEDNHKKVVRILLDYTDPPQKDTYLLFLDTLHYCKEYVGETFLDHIVDGISIGRFGHTTLSEQKNSQKNIANMLLDCSENKTQKDKCQLTYSLRLFIDANKKHANGCTPLGTAVMQGHEKIVKKLLDLKAYPTEESPADTLNTLLHSAIVILDSNANIVKMLLYAKADANPQGHSEDTPREQPFKKEKTTPLFEAIKKGREDIVSILLEFKADPAHENPLGTGETPLLHAVNNNNANIVKMLLYAKADANPQGHSEDTPREQPFKKEKTTPLFEAIKKGRENIVSILLEFKADATQENHPGTGETPLLQAVNNSNANIVKMLLYAKADANQQGHREGTPLEQALKNEKSQSPQIWQNLLEYGAEVDDKTEELVKSLQKEKRFAEARDKAENVLMPQRLYILSQTRHASLPSTPEAMRTLSLYWNTALKKAAKEKAAKEAAKKTTEKKPQSPS